MRGLGSYAYILGPCSLAVCLYADAQNLPNSIQPGQIEKQFQRPSELSTIPEVEVPEVSTFAIPPEIGDVKFTIRAINLVNTKNELSTIYSSDEILPFYAEYKDKEVSLRLVFEIADALTAKYRNDGYVLSQVVVPPQRIKDGVVVLMAVEGSVSDVEVIGKSKRIDKSHLSPYFDRIKRSVPLHARELERSLLLINDLPGVTAQATIAPSSAQGQSSISVGVTRPIISGSLGANNRGSEPLGPWRAEADFSIYALVHAFDVLNARYVTGADTQELRFLSFRYNRPIGVNGLSIGVSVDSTRANPGLGANFAKVETASKTATLAVSYPFVRSRSLNIFVRGNFSYHNGQTDANDIILSEDRIRALRLGLSLDRTDKLRGIVLFDVELSQGLDILGARETGSPNLSRQSGRSDFTKVNFSLSRLQSLSSRWSLLVSSTAQYAFTNLLSPEEFAFGGEQFGRAYDASELVGDSGAALKLELRHDLTGNADIQAASLYSFYDIGTVWRNDPIDEKANESAASFGIGSRFSFRRGVTGYLEITKPLTHLVGAEKNKNARVFGGIRVSF